MCLHTKQKEPFIAENDIICYKAVNINSGTIMSQFQNFIYELDKLYETEFSIVEDEIYKGFHSYSENEYERIKNRLNCIKCIIPKGSEYYIGIFSGHDCYCSNKIIIKEIVSDKNKNQYINGKREGYWEEYHENGNLMFKGNYKDGKEDGYCVTYYYDGTVYSKGNYKDDKRISIFKSFFYKLLHK